MGRKGEEGEMESGGHESPLLISPCDGRHADPPAAAPSLLTPTVPHFARLLLTQAPAIPPLLTAVLPASPSLLTPHLLLSHSPPLPALSLFRRLLALPHFPVPESSLPVLLRLLAHLSFQPLDSLPPAHPPSGRELNALLRVFCARGRVAEARALFHRYCDAYPPDTRTFNTLLLGFKEAGHAQALDLFYHDAVLRGFVPDAVSYCVRMDALCKKGRFLDALEMLDEMRRRENCEPTLQVFTTLIYGAGIARDAARARRLFDEMEQCAVTPDRGAHDALMGAYVRARVGDLEGIWKIYSKMICSGFMPRTRTTMLLMKVFCENGRPDLGLELWDYMIGKGCVPHRHALDVLV
ncbi:pentatricopeptide repeat-containing protein At3g61360-like [Brachypodium distachyon]|uniref:pentatricopeptide repeat-containing protein At3g61360-like n=1 Tax=Brachypodium distachyon TaxID=15368 RepID=UPI000D0D4741|nr:pentatricopeptide repeat-containing protein At3g61360-like [Brachypodium distachyon]|eukprot:XP_024313398.1 pentatricopeptide repeat-containing protein At3g61360-like [Brachypodium distachyon]